MSARHALVTGGSKGIGRAVSVALAERGWHVTALARDCGALEETLAMLPGDDHRALSLDVADESAWLQASPTLGDLHGLVCAAAVLDPIGPVDSYTTANFLRTLQVNVVGTLNAIKTCLPSLRANGGAIVTFSGGGATAPLRRFDAYAASKAAVVRLTENMSADLSEMGVRINSVAPGFVATDIHKSTLEAGPGLVGGDYYERTLKELEDGGVPAAESAELVCTLLEDDDDPPLTGKLISAQWDPWRRSDFRRRLAASSDLATIRRIDDMMFSSVTDDGR